MPKVDPKGYRRLAFGQLLKFPLRGNLRRTRDVAAAVGLSESLLTAFASRQGRSTRQGRKFASGEFQKFPLRGNLRWTLGEIAEVLESRRVKRRKRPVSLQMVEEIRAGLICLGFRFDRKLAFGQFQKFPLRGNLRQSEQQIMREEESDDGGDQ